MQMSTSPRSYSRMPLAGMPPHRSTHPSGILIALLQGAAGPTPAAGFIAKVVCLKELLPRSL